MQQRPPIRVSCACVSIAMFLAFTAAPASATPATLRRALSNIVCGPLDVALAPIVGPKMTVDNLRFIDDTPGVRAFWAVPGVVWNTGIEIGLGVIREMTGLLELGPGLLLFFSDSDLDPLLAPVEDSEALVDYETPILHFRFGMFYTA
jgi:hypothetical protein